MIDLTCLTITESYVKPFQRKLDVSVETWWLLWKYLKDTKSEWLLFNSILGKFIITSYQCRNIVFQYVQIFSGMMPK